MRGWSIKALRAKGLEVDVTGGDAPVQPRRQPGTMNKLEADYARHLDILRLAGEVISWHFEALGLRIGNRCFWYPDFMVEVADGSIQLHDTKGHVKDDALVKARACASKFPFPVFHVTKKKGQWSLRRIK